MALQILGLTLGIATSAIADSFSDGFRAFQRADSLLFGIDLASDTLIPPADEFPKGYLALEDKRQEIVIDRLMREGKDQNTKRVLIRVRGIGNWLGEKKYQSAILHVDFPKTGLSFEQSIRTVPYKIESQLLNLKSFSKQSYLLTPVRRELSDIFRIIV